PIGVFAALLGVLNELCAAPGIDWSVLCQPLGKTLQVWHGAGDRTVEIRGKYLDSVALDDERKVRWHGRSIEFGGCIQYRSGGFHRTPGRRRSFRGRCGRGALDL